MSRTLEHDSMQGSDRIGIWREGLNGEVGLFCRWCSNLLRPGSGTHVCAMLRKAAKQNQSDARRCLTRMESLIG
jgi:hypothetical protein